MSPLQKIAMGLVVVLAPSGFRIGGYVWEIVPDPLGWVLVVVGVRALRSELDVDVLQWAGWVAMAVSIPQWIPPLFELFLPANDPTADASIKWAFFVPEAFFLLWLARTIGQAAVDRQPRDRFVAGRFGVLTWAAGALIALPPLAYSSGDKGTRDWTLAAIGLVPWLFVYYLFRVHRREWLGGPGPLEVHPPSAPTA
jgi:hypothetical protein